MAPRLLILSNVIDHLKKLNASVTGQLYGTMYEEALFVLAFSINTVDDDNQIVQSIDLQLCMPTEIDLFGILSVDQYKQEIPDGFKDIDVTDNPLLLKYSLDSAEVNAFYYIHQKLESISFEVVTEDEIMEKFSYVRLRAILPFMSEKETLLENLQETRKKLVSGKVGFHFPDTNSYLLESNIDDDLESKSAKPLLQIPKYSKAKKPLSEWMNSPIINVVNATMLLKMSNRRGADEKVKHAPVVHHVKKPTEYYKLDLRIDSLSLVGHNVTMAGLYEILVESICRNLKLTGDSLQRQLEVPGLDLSLPEPLHFKPLNFGHLLTLVYPVGILANDAYEYRKSIHRRLALETTRPYFKKGNAVKFASDRKETDYLINPHVAVKNPPGLKISLVYGFYEYHHYMQDGFDDSGWGCAYRSLQTIVSWFRLQGYTDKAVPTHQDIQKTLVEIGDKTSNFVDSRQWIGSTEVGFVLETLLDVSIRVLCASNGEEMSSMVSDLAYHFHTQGTPIMIGGGVLAHTILGVAYDESYENVQFLILDPHYTGQEQLSTVVSKGWCGWKDKNFWRKDAFYNMCLPQKPKTL